MADVVGCQVVVACGVTSIQMFCSAPCREHKFFCNMPDFCGRVQREFCSISDTEKVPKIDMRSGGMYNEPVGRHCFPVLMGLWSIARRGLTVSGVGFLKLAHRQVALSCRPRSRSQCCVCAAV